MSEGGKKSSKSARRRSKKITGAQLKQQIAAGEIRLRVGQAVVEHLAMLITDNLRNELALAQQRELEESGEAPTRKAVYLDPEHAFGEAVAEVFPRVLNRTVEDFHNRRYKLPKHKFMFFKGIASYYLQKPAEHRLRFRRGECKLTLEILPREWKLDETGDRMVHLPTIQLVQGRRQLSDVCRDHGCSIKDDERMQANHMEHPGLAGNDKSAAAVPLARYAKAAVVELDQAFLETYAKVVAMIEDMIDVFHGDEASIALKVRIFRLFEKIEASCYKAHNPEITIKGRKHILRIDTGEWEFDEQAGLLVHKPSARAEVERLGIAEACLAKGCSSLCDEKDMEKFWSNR